MKRVSVVVPVYNVEKYVDKCISSIVEQTYKELEILLVINKSNDKSDYICEKWKNQDDRIKCIYPLEKGLGNARNVGIKNASGDYICFIDSDDWVDNHYIEYMISELNLTGADIVDCHYCRVYDDGSGQYASDCMLNHYMEGRLYEAYVSPCAWRSLSKLSLWTENGIVYTNTIAEDLSVYSLIRGIAKKISHVDNVLYYYRIRQDSLSVSVTADLNKFSQLLEVLEWIANEHRKRSLFDNNRHILFRQAENHIRSNIIFFSKSNYNCFDYLIDNAKAFLNKVYQIDNNIASRKSISFGSYNLGRINNYLTIECRPWESKYCFSSVISATSKPNSINYTPCDNIFRNIQIERDVKKSIWADINEKKVKVVLWDFLEETSGILIHDGNYITNSEAIGECYRKSENDDEIRFGSDKWWVIWKKSVNDFISLLEQSGERIQIILIKMCLSEYYGKTGPEKEFENIKQIQEINRILEKMYKYVEHEYPDLICFELPNNDLLYSDEDFEYGCSPRHLNYALYAYMGRIVSDYLLEQGL